jgi:hypothetical protein
MIENLANDPFVQQLRQPLPELSVTPEPMYPVQPINFYGSPPRSQYPLQTPQPYYMQPSAAFTPVISRHAIPRQLSAQPMSPRYYPTPQHFFPPQIADNYPIYGQTFDAPQYRTAPPTPRQLSTPLYQQLFPASPVSYGTGPRRHPQQTDLRNTSPSGGYITTSTNSPTPVIFQNFKFNSFLGAWKTTLSNFDFASKTHTSGMNSLLNKIYLFRITHLIADREAVVQVFDVSSYVNAVENLHLLILVLLSVKVPLDPVVCLNNKRPYNLIAELKRYDEDFHLFAVFFQIHLLIRLYLLHLFYLIVGE